MNTDIFLNYRRDDEPAFVGRLHDHLKRTFPHHALFIDVDAIQAGSKFGDRIVSQLAKCSAFIPVIGPQWLSSSRLFQDGDWVRKEIESALLFKTPIFPILVNDTAMPKAASVPRSIAGLCAISAVRLTDASFEEDVKPLIRALKTVLKHHTEKHFTVGEYEAMELGRKVGADTFDRISKGINVSFEKISALMIERFFPVVEAVIARRDAVAMQNTIAKFKEEAITRGLEIEGAFINFVCEDMPYLNIRTSDPTDPLYVAVETHIHKEVFGLLNGMMEHVAVATANLINDAGWDFIPDQGS